MTRQRLESRVKKILVEESSEMLDPEAIRDDTSLYGQGFGLDSVDVVGLIVRLENEFRVSFEDAEILESVKTFGALVDSLRRKLRHHGRPLRRPHDA
jgi:acyl carrier protein